MALSIPLEISGVNDKGVPFEGEAKTIFVNRHGARIRTSRALTPGQTIRLANLVSRRQAEFRVVGPVSPRTEKGGEWGVETLDNNQNIWGIQFPPRTSGDSEVSALLNCMQCHAEALMHVSIVEVEVLETSGVISKPCSNCGKETAWSIADKNTENGGSGDEKPTDDRPESSNKQSRERKHRRVALRLPILIREYSGRVEITKTENVSKGGACFTSENDYNVGEGITVACPYSAGDRTIEVRARIVHKREVEGSNRKIYGISYHS